MDTVTSDTRLLQHLATHGILEALAGLDEAGEHRVPALRPRRLSAEEYPFAVYYPNDDRRIGAGKMLASAAGPAATP